MAAGWVGTVFRSIVFRSGPSAVVNYGDTRAVMGKDTQSLDHVTTAVQLALLSYMPLGTRLSIQNSEIHLQPPAALQWLHRRCNYDEGEDVSSLRLPITQLHAAYSGDHANEDVRRLISCAAGGLRRLADTYNELKRRVVRDVLLSYADILDTDPAQAEEVPEPVREMIRAVWAPEELRVLRLLVDMVYTADVSEHYRADITTSAQILLGAKHRERWS